MNTANISVPKDPAFKLFGRQIPLPHSPIPPKDICSGLTNSKTEVSFGEDNSRESNKSFGQGKEDNSTHIQVNKAQISSKPGEDGAEATCSEQEKLLKKPDKVVPCPRCNSLETKFCYFNNYNVNQPRHFCKNCQRYWTAGGTMRNVPIGAGRRKNKHLASQYREILVSSDGVPITRMENSDSANHQFMSSVESAATSGPSTGNGVVLKFGPEAPLCESMENALNIGEQNRFVEMRGNCPDNGEEPSSCISSLTSSSVRVNEMTENVAQKEQVCLSGPSNAPNVTNSLRCYPAPSLVFPWNPTWNHVASMAAAQYSSGQPCAVVNGNAQNQVQWCPRPVMAVPSFCPPNIPVQLVPAPYWGCMSMWTGGAGNVSFSASNGCLSPSSSTSTSCCSGNGSPTLGKHCRDTMFMEEERAEKNMLVPKTLRIDDQSEGSRGPLLAKPGLKPDLKDLRSKGTVFKIYETKGEGKDHVSDATYILEANPAALSRSHTFQEST